MSGKILGSVILAAALVTGIAMYYLQVYGYYDRVSLGPNDLALTLVASQVAEPIPAENVSAIDADSSPLRFRACFTTPLSLAMLTETYVVYEAAEPLIAPNWFDCFDAEAIGAALAAGQAVAFLGEKNIHYGVDRVVAVFDDGRAFAWHQLNNCGQTAYDGTPVGEDCPPRGE